MKPFVYYINKASILGRRTWSRRLVRNGIASVVQSGIQIICLFLSYRILVREESVGGLGLWALIMVFNGGAALVDVSGTSALSRSLPRHGHDFKGYSVSEIVHTTLLSSLFINLALATVFLVIAAPLLSLIIAGSELELGVKLVPWAAAILILTPLSVGTLGALDGMMRSDLRAVTSTGSVMLSLIVAWLFVPEFGLFGFAAAQAFLLLFNVVVGWLFLRGIIPALSWLPHMFRPNIFKSSVHYALRLNLIGLSTAIIDPVMRLLIGSIGGTQSLGLYELASKLVIQLRGLALAALSPTLPAFAGFAGPRSAGFQEISLKVERFGIAAGFAVLIGAAAATPLMSFVILDRVDISLVRISLVLAVGWGANVFMLSSFLAAQAQGIMRWNFWGGLLPVGGAVAAHMILSPVTDQLRALVGLSVGLAVGSLITIWGNAHEGIGVADAPKAVARILTAIVIALALTFLIWASAYWALEA